MKRHSLLFSIVGCFFFDVALAQSFASDYFRAQNAIVNGEEISQFSSLKDHPLYPDLAADFYANHLDRNDEITALFTKHYALAPIKKLHNQWISKQFYAGDYATLVKHYFASGDETSECMYRSAQLQLGNREVALEQIQWTWMKPYSVSAICDSVFAEWGGENRPDNVVQRAVLAYRAGNDYLAIRLASRLSPGSPVRDTLLQFANYLKNPTALLQLSPSQLRSDALSRQLFPTALQQLIRLDSSRYAGFAMQFARGFNGDKDYERVLNKLTEYLSKREDIQAARVYKLISHPSRDSSDALIHFLVKQGDWQTIRQTIAPQNNHAIALYWLGRALEMGGKRAKAARAAYAKAAKIRSYYGFLAADKIGAAYRFNADIIQPTEQTSLSQNQSLIRAKWLAKYGDSLSARREILRLSALMSPARQRQLAYWLHANGFYFEAIVILGKARDWDAIRIRFPMPFQAEVNRASQTAGVDKTWVYSIMRQESSMNPQAQSRAKAQGLMQLIPSTARSVARELGVSLDGDDIFNPAVNTQLGTTYLANMFYRFGNVALASAAYNAGPARVDEWTQSGIEDMVMWVERIPFSETRKYVKRILEYQQVYAHLMRVKLPRITQRLAGDYQAVK